MRGRQVRRECRRPTERLPLHREFPRQAPSEWDDAVDRRDFLKLMAASLAFAGLSGCGRTPEQYIVPYVKQPDGLTLGKPQFYATAMPFGADAIGLLVESHEGRPTKIEGNPDHPSSLGATNVFAQASVLNLYDPDRAQTVTKFGEIQTWSLFVDSAQAIAAAMKERNPGWRGPQDGPFGPAEARSERLRRPRGIGRGRESASPAASALAKRLSRTSAAATRAIAGAVWMP